MSESNMDLRGDLVWWRAGPWRTLVTIHGDLERTNGLPPGSLPVVTLELVLHDAGGTERARHELTLERGEHAYIDSQHAPGELAAAAVPDGVLALFVKVPADTPGFHRLYVMVDWSSDAGELVSLHSDQSLVPGAGGLELTEIVAEPGQETELVFLNGPVAQPPEVIRLSVRNYRGRSEEAVYAAPLAPFSRHRIELGALFPRLEALASGRPVSVSGVCLTEGLFVRPYVVTRGERHGGFHGGNRYSSWKGIPAFVHRALGRGETNPILAVHDAELTTAVHLFSSHGSVKGAFGVDCRLYDAAGALVAERSPWLKVPRNGVVRGELAALLDGAARFTGHLSLSFTGDASKREYPRHLQALVEYRTARSLTRVMTWSDLWNAAPAVRALHEKLGPLAPMLAPIGIVEPPATRVSWRSHFRVWCRPPLVTRIAITHGGTTDDLTGPASYVVTLEGPGGRTRTWTGELAPWATALCSVCELFPDADELLGPLGVGMLSIESTHDLALMQLTRDARSGAVSAEHFMSQASYVDGVSLYPSGS